MSSRIYECDCGTIWTRVRFLSRVVKSLVVKKRCPDCEGYESYKAQQKVKAGK